MSLCSRHINSLHLVSRREQGEERRGLLELIRHCRERWTKWRVKNPPSLERCTFWMEKGSSSQPSTTLHVCVFLSLVVITGFSFTHSPIFQTIVINSSLMGASPRPARRATPFKDGPSRVLKLNQHEKNLEALDLRESSRKRIFIYFTGPGRICLDTSANVD